MSQDSIHAIFNILHNVSWPQQQLTFWVFIFENSKTSKWPVLKTQRQNWVVSTDSERSNILVSWSILTFCSNGDLKILKQFENDNFRDFRQFCQNYDFSNCFKISKSLLEQKVSIDHESRMFDLSESVETTQFCCCILSTGHFEVLEFSKMKTQKVSCCCGQLTL